MQKSVYLGIETSTSCYFQERNEESIHSSTAELVKAENQLLHYYLEDLREIQISGLLLMLMKIKFV